MGARALRQRPHCPRQKEPGRDAARSRRPPPRVLTASEREGGATECQGHPLGGGMPRPSEGGTGQVDFPCAQVWAGTGPLANLSTKPECCPLTCPCPAKELSLFPLCHHQRRTGEGVLVLAPHPPASVSLEPLGGARASRRLQPGLISGLSPVLPLVAGAQGPRQEGQRTHRAGPNPRPSLSQALCLRLDT